MSFGWSVSDIASLTLLAWKTVQNTRKACGEHDELTQEVASLHIVLRRLEKELQDPTSPLNRQEDSCRMEIEAIASGCRKELIVLDRILEKYNALGEKRGGFRKLKYKVLFGNGRMADLPNLRSKVTYYTIVLQAQLQLVSMGSAPRIERRIENTRGEIRNHLKDTREDIKNDLQELKAAVSSITVQHATGKGSPLTPYLDDDRAVWREFRRELVKAGFSSTFLQKHRKDIQTYFEELGGRDMLSGASPKESCRPPEGSPHNIDPQSLIPSTSKPRTEQSRLIVPPRPESIGPQITLLEAIAEPRNLPKFMLPPPALDLDTPWHAMKAPQTAIRLSPVSKKPATYQGEDRALRPVFAMAPCDIFSDSIFGSRQIADHSRSVDAQSDKQRLSKSKQGSASFVISESPYCGNDGVVQRYHDQALFTVS